MDYVLVLIITIIGGIIATVVATLIYDWFTTPPPRGSGSRID